MKHRMRVMAAFISLLLVMTVWQCKDVGETKEPEPENTYQKAVNPTSPFPVKAWSYLFYNAADFTPGYDPSLDFSREMYEHENAYVIMLRDVHANNADRCNGGLNLRPGDASAGIFRVMEDKVELQKDLGEVNMGQSATLSDFITYAKTYFPAERYVLAFYDHGGGYLGSCSDNTDNDWLYMDEKRAAFEQSGGVDMILFTAPCLMASLEAMYEVRQHTDVYIGSENLSGFCYWSGTLNDVRDLMQTDPGLPTLDLAAAIVRILNNYGCEQYGGRDSMTFSAVRSDRLDELVAAADELAGYYIDHEDRFAAFFDGHYDTVQTFENYNMDLDSLALRLKEVEADPVLWEISDRLREALAAAVVAEVHGPEVSVAGGVAIFCPKKRGGVKFDKTQYGRNQFARDTRWGDILSSYYTGQTSQVNLNQILAEHNGLHPSFFQNNK